MEPPENAVIALVLAGDQQPYGDLVSRYEVGLTNHCYRLIGDEDEAADMAQEAFTKAYFQLSTYDSKYRFSTWLYKIATNLCYDELRKRSKQQPVGLDAVADRATEADGPERLAERHHEAARVQTAVQKLPENYRSAVSLYYWEEQSYEEIATILEVPLGTVRTWLRRGKEQLKQELHGSI